MPVVQWFYLWRMLRGPPPPSPEGCFMEEGQAAKYPSVDGTRTILSPNDMRAFAEKYLSSLVLGMFEFEESFWRFSPPSFPPILIRRVRNNLLTDLYDLALGIPLIKYSRESHEAPLPPLCVHITNRWARTYLVGPRHCLKNSDIPQKSFVGQECSYVNNWASSGNSRIAGMFPRSGSTDR